jgi:hypothetical protein
MLSLFIGAVTAGMETATDELSHKLLKQRTAKNLKRIEMLKMTKKELKLDEVKGQILKLEKNPVKRTASVDSVSAAVGTDDVVLVGLKKQKQQLEYEIEEYRQETEEVKNLRKKIGEIEGRHEAFRSAEDEAKLMSLQQKLGTALRATGRGSVHYRACCRPSGRRLCCRRCTRSSQCPRGHSTCCPDGRPPGPRLHTQPTRTHTHHQT